MKTRIIAMLMLVLLAGTVTYAGTNGPDNKPGLSERIRSEVTYPAFAQARNLEGIVLVSFHVASDGRIVIDESNGSDPDLKAYVRNKIENLGWVADQSLAGERFNMKFIFRIE